MADPQPAWTGYCNTHSKRLFSSRKLARKQIRDHRNGARMRAYRCELVKGHWHIGHLPLAVVTGEKTATEVYGDER